MKECQAVLLHIVERDELVNVLLSADDFEQVVIGLVAEAIQVDFWLRQISIYLIKRVCGGELGALGPAELEESEAAMRQF